VERREGRRRMFSLFSFLSPCLQRSQGIITHASDAPEPHELHAKRRTLDTGSEQHSGTAAACHPQLCAHRQRHPPTSCGPPPPLHIDQQVRDG